MVYLPWVLFIAKETDRQIIYVWPRGRKRGSVGSTVVVNDDFPKVSRFVVK
jgi:hypothetical protein